MRSPSQHRDGQGASQPEGDCRCRCGSLVARIVDGGVEIKCRRCKRDLLVPWSAREGWVRPVERASLPVERASLPVERAPRPIAIDGGRS